MANLVSTEFYITKKHELKSTKIAIFFNNLHHEVNVWCSILKIRKQIIYNEITMTPKLTAFFYLQNINKV